MTVGLSVGTKAGQVSGSGGHLQAISSTFQLGAWNLEVAAEILKERSPVRDIIAS